MELEDGLGEVWNTTQSALLETIPIYERGNHVMSFGRDMGYRREGIMRTVRGGDLVLDLGCGPGIMGQIVLDSVEAGGLVLADPLRPMLDAARTRINGKPAPMIASIFEQLPFRDGIFDVVMCGFSFRDARSYRAATKEIARVLKKESGRFLIVDLGKPDDLLRRLPIGLYFRFAVGFMTFLSMGRRGLVFSKIYPTYRKYLTISRIRRLLEDWFEEVKIETKMMGGVMVAVARKAKST